MSENQRHMKSLIGVLLAGMIMSSTFIPAAASASTLTGYSDITLSKSDIQLSVSAPAVTPIALKSSGKLLSPDASSFAIVNNSNVPIFVKSLKTRDVLDGSDLVRYLDVTSIDDSATIGKRNVWGMDVSANDDHVDLVDTENVDLALNNVWNVGAKSTLGVEMRGQIKQVDGSIDFSEPQKLCTMVWTFSTEFDRE